MPLGRSETGLLENTAITRRCDYCDLPLSVSTWKNRQIVYSTSKNPRDGFICVRCSIKKPIKNKNSKPKVIIDDLDNYLAKLLGIN